MKEENLLTGRSQGDKNGEQREEQTFEKAVTSELDYINAYINPILSKMMIRVINQNPSDIVGFMIEYLKEQEQYDQQHNFSQMLASTIASRQRLHSTMAPHSP